jgi:hypothetical protein
MPLIANPSFETAYAGATTEYGPGGVGRPDGWTITTSTTGVGFAIAGFAEATADEYPWETFEGNWDSNESYTFAFTDPSTQLEQPLYFTIYALPKPQEDFSEGWDANEYYVYNTDSSTAAVFNTAPNDTEYEAFSREWSGNENYLYALSSVSAASFDTTPENFENFEEDWVSGYLYAFVGPGTDLTAASFDVTPQNYEDFEEDWSSLVMTTI